MNLGYMIVSDLQSFPGKQHLLERFAGRGSPSRTPGGSSKPVALMLGIPDCCFSAADVAPTASARSSRS